MDERNGPGPVEQSEETVGDRVERRAPVGRRPRGHRDVPSHPRGYPDGWPPLLTVNEVAALLRTSRKAVYAMAERAQLPGVTRIGRRLLVGRDDLLAWLDERRAASRGGAHR
jgi:excisionase family DNA binding protein